MLSPGSRRPLLIYLAAVVGPTLVVLTLGVLAAMREHQAMDVLRVTTTRLQEARIADELDRSLAAAASSALGDPAVLEIVSRTRTGDPRELDAAEALARGVRTRHPVVARVFVVCPDGSTFPRLESAMPRSLDDWLERDPAAAAHTRKALEEAFALEGAQRFRDAARAFEGIRQAAHVPSLAAFALAGVARAHDAAGDRDAAIKAWDTIVRSYPDQYTLNDRPAALVASLELQRLGEGAGSTARDAVKAFEAGRWSLAPEQADYFLQAFGRPESSSTALGVRTAFARALAREWQPPTMAGQVQPAWLAEVSTQLFHLRQPDGTTVGVALDARRVRSDLLARTARAVAPGAVVGPVSSSDGAPLKRTFPGWRVALDLSAHAVPLWRRGDVVAFGATTAVVLALLVLGVVLLLRDVSRQSALNRLRADLVSGVSHELKAPLSVIRVYAETLGQAADAPPADRAQFAAAIVQETDRLHRAIDDVVDFSRIEQGERVYRKAPIAMRALLDRVVERFRQYATLHGFRLRTDLASDLPTVSVDSSAVEQAIHNLLDNACKYSGDARDIELRASRGDGHVLVEVRDRGVGIAPEEQTRIFQRFHRGRHDDRGGYGLGLYLVTHIMEAHGGSVDVESAPGAGSRFTLRFPLEG